MWQGTSRSISIIRKAHGHMQRLLLKSIKQVTNSNSLWWSEKEHILCKYFMLVHETIKFVVYLLSFTNEFILNPSFTPFSERLIEQFLVLRVNIRWKYLPDGFRVGTWEMHWPKSLWIIVCGSEFLRRKHKELLTYIWSHIHVWVGHI